MKFKKLVALSSAIIIGSMSLIGCSNKADNKNNSGAKETIKVGMVADTGGINDESFNQSAWEGLQEAEKELGIEIKVIESRQASEYLGNIETLVDDGMNLIIGVGYTMADDIKTQAENYPDVNFALIDETYDEIPSNVKSVLFESEQASYLVGLIAGKMSETKNVGFIGGLDIPVINTFKYGYMAGAKTADANCEIQAQYANSFTDQAKGKAIANQMISKNADVIFTAGGDVGTGAAEAVKEANKYAIGVDRDQSDLAPNNVLTSAIKRVDVGIYETVKALVEGKFEGGTSITYGLEEDAVGVPETTKNLVPQDVLDFVDEQIEKLKAGEIKVPKTEEEYNEFLKSL